MNFSRIMDGIMELFRENSYEAQFITTKAIQEERSIRMWFQTGKRITISLNTNSDVFSLCLVNE